jgi:hypothetical protein
LDVESDQTAITEVIHKPNDIYEKTLRVYVNRPSDDPNPDELQHDVVLVRGGAKVQFVGDEFEAVRGSDDDITTLESTGKELLANEMQQPGDDIEAYDQQTEERLRRLGYLE